MILYGWAGGIGSSAKGVISLVASGSGALRAFAATLKIRSAWIAWASRPWTWGLERFALACAHRITVRDSHATQAECPRQILDDLRLSQKVASRLYLRPLGTS